MNEHSQKEEMVITGFLREQFEMINNSFIPLEIKQLCHIYWGSYKLSITDAVNYEKEIERLMITKAHGIADKKHNESDECLLFGYFREYLSIWENILIPDDIQLLCYSFVGSMTMNLAAKIDVISANLQQTIEVEMVEINKRAICVDAELAEAKPALEAAQKAVSYIHKHQLNEIRALKRPPQICMDVFVAVAIAFGKKSRRLNWKDIQKMISARDFIPNVLKFDANTIKCKWRKKIRKMYLSNENFTYERANRASKVCGPLLLWVKAQVEFAHLLDSVEPMTREIEELKAKMDAKQRKCNDYNALVSKLALNVSVTRT